MKQVNFEKVLTEGLAFLEQMGVILAPTDIKAVDLLGLECPEPLMMLRQAVRQVSGSTSIVAFATDQSTQRDIPSYCRFTGNSLIQELTLPHQPPIYVYVFEKK